MNKPTLSKQAFWDVDMANIDYKKNARYVIEKVIDRGSFEDFKSIRNFYGDSKIRKEIIKSKNLNTQGATFCCAIFNLDIKDFKFNIKRYSYPVWDFNGA